MTAVVILGMHRSGTSSLVGTLQQCGLYLGQVFESNPYNRKGNRESAEIMRLNDSVLASSGGSWDDPPSTVTWTSDLSRARDSIIGKFIEAKRPQWGFKDPRTLLTLDFWLEGLQGIQRRYVGSFRHPSLVARSLNARDHMPFEKAFWLWELYDNRLLQLQRQSGFPLLSFDANADEYRLRVRHILADLNLQDETDSEPTFFDDALRHTGADEGTQPPLETMDLYHQLMEIYQDQMP